MKHKKIWGTVLLLTALLTACSAGDAPQDTAPTPEETSQAAPDDNPADTTAAEAPAPIQDEPEPAEPNLVEADLTPSEGLEFESNGDGTCTLTGIGVCEDTDLVIPTQSPVGDTVTLIAENAFFSLENVDSVTLLNYAYEVDERAFQYGEMTALHIIGGAPIIGDSAFSSCEDLTEVTFEDCTLQLGEYAFFSCGKDASVTFSNCTGTVGERAFQYGNLVSLSLENCDLQLEKSAFSSCEDLTAISLRNSTISAEEYAFFSVGDAAVVESMDCDLSLEDRAFQYASLGTLSITGGTLEMGESVFSSCEDLSAVVLDSPTVTLGEYAFYGCEDLTGVTICDNGRADNTITIDDRAFQYCKNLSAVTIGTGTVEIGESVFSGCADALYVTVSGQAYTNIS